MYTIQFDLCLFPTNSNSGQITMLKRQVLGSLASILNQNTADAKLVGEKSDLDEEPTMDAKSVCRNAVDGFDYQDHEILN